MYMLVMVLDDTAHLHEVLEAWLAAGLADVTILESTGSRRVLRRTTAEPAYMGFSQLLGDRRVGHNTLLAVIDDLALAEKAVEATEACVGSLNQPDTGIIFAMPVVKTWGMPKRNAQDDE